MSIQVSDEEELPINEINLEDEPQGSQQTTAATTQEIPKSGFVYASGGAGKQSRKQKRQVRRNRAGNLSIREHCPHQFSTQHPPFFPSNLLEHQSTTGSTGARTSGSNATHWSNRQRHRSFHIASATVTTESSSQRCRSRWTLFVSGLGRPTRKHSRLQIVA